MSLPNSHIMLWNPYHRRDLKFILKEYVLNFLTSLNVPNIVSVNKCLCLSLCCFISWSSPGIATGIIWTIKARGISTIVDRL